MAGAGWSKENQGELGFPGMLCLCQGAVANCRDTRYRPVVLAGGLVHHCRFSLDAYSVMQLLWLRATLHLPGGRRLDLHDALAQLDGAALAGTGCAGIAGLPCELQGVAGAFPSHI